jgi:hypothetical protein
MNSKVVTGTRRAGTAFLAGALGAVIALALSAPAGATRTASAGTQSARVHARHGMLPRVQPAAGTPHFPASTPVTEQVRQLVQCGNIMYAVGRFSVIEQGNVTYTRNNAFSFAATAPFTVTSWNPNVNGEVNSIVFNAGNCAYAYLGGNFTQVHGLAASRIAKVHATGAGALVNTFRHSANDQVETLASYQKHLLVGGSFTAINGSPHVPFMISLNPRSGRNDDFLNLHISGHLRFHRVKANSTHIYNQQISHGGRRDLVEGNFTSVSGRRRHQIFMLDLASRPRATLMSWTSPRFDGTKGYPPSGYFFNCARGESFYIRAAAWSPNDGTVYMAATGFRPWNHTTLPDRGLCDAASAFSANGPKAAFKWTNYTGCYSLYSVAANARAAFFAGHELYSQNRLGCKGLGPGGISAPGMEALNPATGLLLLNAKGTALYTRGRGLGADDMLFTKAGLWIASDNFKGTQTCDSVPNLAGICFLPYT